MNSLISDFLKSVNRIFCWSSTFLFISSLSVQSEIKDEHLLQAQYLPVEAIWCPKLGGCIFLEVADQESEQRIGMMQRPFLKEGEGMLFPFLKPRIARFWMYKTLFPLDIIFIKQGKVIGIKENLPVCDTLPCPVYLSSYVSDSAIELNAGEVSRRGIKLGDNAVVEFLVTGQTK